MAMGGGPHASDPNMPKHLEFGNMMHHQSKDFDTSHQNYQGPGNFDYYGNPYHAFMEHQRNQQMFNNHQYGAMMRPGMVGQMNRPGMNMYMPGRMMDSRIPQLYQQRMSEMEMHQGMNHHNHMPGMAMNMNMPPHMHPAMVRHPGMMNPAMSGQMGLPPGAGRPSMNPGMMGGNALPLNTSMNPIGVHGGIAPRNMSPQTMPQPDRQLVGPPSASPKAMQQQMNERSPLYSSQYRMPSPQYNSGQQGSGRPAYGQSPTYPGGTQNYQRPPTPQNYKPPPPRARPHNHHHHHHHQS